MTARQLYEGVLIEVNKTGAPNLLLEDFNYFVNKAINLYTNKRYNIYDVNLQTTDDLRVLKATAVLNAKKIDDDAYRGLSTAAGANYEITLPMDYLHMLNCICIYKVKKTYKCYNAGIEWRAAAKRLTADAYSLVIDNFWNKPTYKNPYYYIHNVNLYHDSIPTNPYVSTTGTGTDVSEVVDIPLSSITAEKILGIDNSYYKYNGVNLEKDPNSETIYYYKGIPYVIGTDETEEAQGGVSRVFNTLTLSSDFSNKDYFKNIIVEGKGLPNSVKISLPIGDLSNTKASNIERGGGLRYGNVSQVRCEIRYGTDDSVFKLEKVLVDYIKAPQFIRLTQEQIDLTEDSSQMLEFPDYVCQEIINELVHLIMENQLNLRISTHPVVSLSIANPAQQLTNPNTATARQAAAAE